MNDITYGSSGISNPIKQESKSSATDYSSSTDLSFDLKLASDYTQLQENTSPIDEQLQEEITKIVEQESYKTFLNPA